MPATNPNLTQLSPVLTALQVKRHENNSDIDVQRRFVLTFLTKSGQELYDSLIETTDDGQGLLMMTKEADAYTKYLKHMLKLAETAQDRFTLMNQEFLKIRSIPYLCKAKG